MLRVIVSSLFDHDWLEADRRFAIAFKRGAVAPSVRCHYATWHLSLLVCHADALAQPSVASSTLSKSAAGSETVSITLALESHLSDQTLEPRIGAERVPSRISFEPDQPV